MKGSPRIYAERTAVTRGIHGSGEYIALTSNGKRLINLTREEAVKPLTDRQRLAYELCFQALVVGKPLSVRELRDALGVSSIRGATIHLDALVRKGYLTRQRYGTRGYRFLRDADGRLIGDQDNEH